MAKKKERRYTEFAAVEAQHDYIIPEEFPEGPYGASTNDVLGKSTPWEEDQYTHKAFNNDYEKLYEGNDDRKI